MAQRKKTATVQLKLRMKETLRARIEKTAKAGKVSMNTEILQRLERSFETENRFGGPRATALVEVMGQAMMAAGIGGYFEFGKMGHEREWLDFRVPFDRAVAAARKILEHNRPEVDRLIPPRKVVEVVEQGDAEIASPQNLNEKIHRAYADLGALLAALESSDPEEKK